MSLAHVTDHEDRGAALLTEQFKRRPKIVAWLKSYLAQVQQLEDAAWTLREQRALATAQGTNLDVLGALVGQPRGGRSDELYRVWIGARMLVNRSAGKASQIIAIASKLAGTVTLKEWPPAAFEVYATTPVDGLTGVQIAKLLALAKAAGVMMHFIWYDVPNPFQFSASGESVMSSPYGFGTGRFAAVSDGRDMGFESLNPPSSGGGSSLLTVL